MHLFFFFNDTATTEIYTLSLHDALPICVHRDDGDPGHRPAEADGNRRWVDLMARIDGSNPGTGSSRSFGDPDPDRKSTRLNSSHANISYAVFCLKKKKKTNNAERRRERP